MLNMMSSATSAGTEISAATKPATRVASQPRRMSRPVMWSSPPISEVNPRDGRQPPLLVVGQEVEQFAKEADVGLVGLLGEVVVVGFVGAGGVAHGVSHRGAIAALLSTGGSSGFCR
jgi:hypothetical protein